MGRLLQRRGMGPASQGEETMSADAKMWPEDDGWHGWNWRGICDATDTLYEGTMDIVLEEILRDMKCTCMRWEIQLYPDGLMGLRGFRA